MQINIQSLLPKRGVTYRSYAIPAIKDKEYVQWGNPDDQYTITYDVNTKQLTGVYYDWSEEEEDWVDTDSMTDETLKSIVEGNLICLA